MNPKTIKILTEVLFDDQRDIDAFHDCIFDSTGKTLEKEELFKIFESLPLYIKAIAFTHGMSDTVFRDLVFEFLQRGKE